MRSVETAAPPPPVSLIAATPWPLLGALACLAAVTAGLAAVEILPPALARTAGLVAGHGALLATGLAWSLSAAEAAAAVVVLAVAALLATISPVLTPAYLAVPVWTLWRGRRAAAAWVRFDRADARSVMAGVAIGALLGGHVLVATTFTLAHRIRLESAAAWLPWLMYDVGVNVPATEVFVRVLFERTWRRWTFAVASAMTTAAYVARYLADPLLPRTVEAAIGAILYLTMLGAAACALRSMTGRPWGAAVAALAFFVSYRFVGRW